MINVATTEILIQRTTGTTIEVSSGISSGITITVIIEDNAKSTTSTYRNKNMSLMIIRMIVGMAVKTMYWDDFCAKYKDVLYVKFAPLWLQQRSQVGEKPQHWSCDRHRAQDLALVFSCFCVPLGAVNLRGLEVCEMVAVKCRFCSWAVFRR